MPYIAVASEVLEQLDLSQSPLCQDLFAENIGDFLDGNTFSCVIVRGSTKDRILVVSRRMRNGLARQTAKEGCAREGSGHTTLCHKHLDPAP